MKTKFTKWAIQKNGKLTEKSIAIINEVYATKISSPDFSAGEYYEDSSANFSVFLVRDDDIPFLVDRGYCDIGVSSEIVREEAQCNNLLSHKLNYLLCSLVYAENGTPSDDENILVTKFPIIAKKLYGDKFDIVKLHGGTELAHKLNISPRLLELSQSGESLKRYGYKVVQTIKEYDTELIVQKNAEALLDDITRKIA